MTPCGALRASSSSSRTVTTSSIWSWILLCFFFPLWLWWRILHRYVSTNRRHYAQKPLHRAAFTRRYSYTERFVHNKTVVRRRLYTQRFLRKEGSIYKQMLCTKMFLRAIKKGTSHRFFYTQNLFHREAFAQSNFYTCFFYLHKITFGTEKLVHTDCTQIFFQTNFFARRNFTQSSFYTAETLAKKPLRTKKQYVICTAGFTDRRFLHRKFSTKVLRTEGFTHNMFYIQTLFHTDVFTQTQIAHRNLCTQHAFTHSQPLHWEALLPLLDHLPTFSVPPFKWVVVIDRLTDRLDSLMWCFQWYV